MTGADGTRWGVRVCDPSEMRRIALLAGFVVVAFSIGNVIVQLAMRDLIAHPDAYLALGVFGFVVGAATFAVGLLSRQTSVGRFWAAWMLVLLLMAALALPLGIHLHGYPISGIASTGYPVVAILAFYLLTRWLALTVVAMIVVAHGMVEIAADLPYPAWAPMSFIAIALLTAGYFTAELMDRLEQSRNAERSTARAFADLNANLEAKVVEQVEEVERFGRLRRFLAAPVAEAVLSSSDESALQPHRREIAVLFCDLRGFTAFTKQVEPEEVMEVLDAYYVAAGAQITKFQATLGSFEGDGLMAYLNDPVPCDEPARRVVEMGLAIADAIDALTPTWHRRGYDLSYGIGMALGHATLGIVGYDGRSDYTAMGTVVNLGARLCGTAQARELVADRRVFLQTEDVFSFSRREPVALKGFGEPVANYLVDRR